MSEENVASFMRAVEANNRREVDAFLAELHPDVEWHPGLPALLGGETAVGRGHDGARALLGDVYEALAEFHLEISGVRDLDDLLVAFGRMRARGRESGAETESPWAYVVRYEGGKAIEIRTYLDPQEALEAAGLSD